MFVSSSKIKLNTFINLTFLAKMKIRAIGRHENVGSKCTYAYFKF